MNKIFKKLVCFLLIAGMLFGTSACGNSGKDDQNTPTVTTADDSLNIVMTTAPVGLHPIKTNDSASTDINAQVYETLYRRSLDGKSYEPLLATALPVCDEAGTTCTITLQQGVTFQDGTPFNSEAVKYTIEKIQDPDYGAARASIANSIESIECPDDYTVVLHLLYPDGVLTAKLAHTNSAIVSPTADQNQDLMVEPVGTGPYKFVSMISGSEVVLTRNDAYWGTAPEIKDITFTVITDVSTAISRLETGEADILKTVPETSVSRAQAISGYTTVTQPSSAITYLALRNNSSVNPIMSELPFRQAIMMAIDCDTYVSSVLGGLGSHSGSILGPTVFGYTDASEAYAYSYDPDAAKQIIIDNGYADEEITFLINNRSTTVALAEYIQASLKAVGFNNVKIVQEEWAAYLSDAKLDNAYDMTILTWSNVTGDGSECLEPNFSSVAGSQRVRYNNTDFDALVDASKKTLDSAERISALDAASKMIEEDAVVSPLYNTFQIFTFNAGYENVNLDPGGLLYITDITIVK